MFGYLVQPFLITLCLTVFLVATFALILRKRSVSFGRIILVAVFLFVPACFGVMFALDKYRFGFFNYQTIEEIADQRTKLWIPPQALNITIYKSKIGHLARFSIEQKPLVMWLESMRETSAVPKEQQPEFKEIAADSQEFRYPFDDVDWELPKDCVKYNIILRDNGAGISVWYSLKEKKAFLRGYYW